MTEPKQREVPVPSPGRYRIKFDKKSVTISVFEADGDLWWRYAGEVSVHADVHRWLGSLTRVEE